MAGGTFRALTKRLANPARTEWGLSRQLVSLLSAKQLQGIVHSVDDLKSVRVGAVGTTASLDYLAQRNIRFRTYATPQEGLAALVAGKLEAFVYDQPLLAWYVHQDFRESVEVLDITFDKQSYAIALPNGSPLRASINVALLELISSSWWSELNLKCLGEE